VVFDSVWGVIPPPKKNTAWNKGRKCFHCLGAPNNLIRRWGKGVQQEKYTRVHVGKETRERRNEVINKQKLKKENRRLPLATPALIQTKYQLRSLKSILILSSRLFTVPLSAGFPSTLRPRKIISNNLPHFNAGVSGVFGLQDLQCNFHLNRNV